MVLSYRSNLGKNVALDVSRVAPRRYISNTVCALMIYVDDQKNVFLVGGHGRFNLLKKKWERHEPHPYNPAKPLGKLH